MHLAQGPLAARRPCIRAGHPGVDPALVEEDEASRVDLGQLGAPCRSRPATGSGRSCSAARRVFCAPSQAAAAPGRRSAGSPARPCARPSTRRTPRGSTRSPPPPAAQRGQGRRVEPRHRAAPRRLCLPAAFVPRLLLPPEQRRRAHPEQAAIRARLSRPRSQARSTRCPRSAE